jgi:flagellar capping protein FliD
VVAVTSMNLIDVQAIVANIMLGDSARSARLVGQKSEQNAEITAFQALNTSLLSVASAADAITGSSSWVPASVSSSDASKATAYATAGATSGASFGFTVDRLSGGDPATAQISYTDGNGDVQSVTSTTNTFEDLADFPGLVITVAATTGEGESVTLTPATTTQTTASTMTAAAQALVSALNASLALITAQTGENGALSTDYTPRDISQKLLNTAWDANTLSSLSDAGIELTRTGSFIFIEGTLTTALSADNAEQVIGQVAAFAARVEAVTNAATSITGSLTREITNRQSRVSDLTDRITEMAADMAAREESLTVYYSQLNAKIQALQNQQSYLQTQLDVFTKALNANR